MPRLPVLVSLLLFAPYLACQEKVTLRHELLPGSSFAHSLDVDVTVHQQLEQQTLDSRVRLVLHFVASVAGTPAAADGTTAVTNEVVRLQAHADSPLAQVDYDSQQPGSDPGPFRQLTLLLGKQFVVRVDPTGRIERVTPPPDLPAGTRDRLPGRDFETLFRLCFVALPEGPIGSGDSWTVRERLLDPALAAGEVPVRSTLERADAERATFVRSYELPAAPARRGVRFAIERSQGTVEFDLQRGRVVKATMELAASAERDAGSGRTTSGTSRVLVTARAEPLPPAPPTASGDRR